MRLKQFLSEMHNLQVCPNCGEAIHKIEKGSGEGYIEPDNEKCKFCRQGKKKQRTTLSFTKTQDDSKLGGVASSVGF